MALEIARRGHEEAPAGGEAPGHEARFLDRPVPQHGVVAVRGRIDAAVVEIEGQLDLLMPRQEGIERRPQMHAPEGDRRRQAERTRQPAAALGEFGGGIRHIAGDAGGPLEEGRPILRQGQLARRAVHEAGAQASLELGQAFADDRFGEAQAPRRLADRSRFRDRHEGRDAVQLHCSFFPEISFWL